MILTREHLLVLSRLREQPEVFEALQAFAANRDFLLKEELLSAVNQSLDRRASNIAGRIEEAFNFPAEIDAIHRGVLAKAKERETP